MDEDELLARALQLEEFGKAGIEPVKDDPSSKKPTKDAIEIIEIPTEWTVRRVTSEANASSLVSSSSSRLPQLPTPRPPRPLDLVSPELERVDPTPDLRSLSAELGRLFFGTTLENVEVKWGSKRMTLCAGLCEYRTGGFCSIRLSPALLPLRPRADLVRTLVHEMIHAYLFRTERIQDHDGHGPKFCALMDEVNARAPGLNVTVYHTFHDEVDVHRQHHWQCDGPCRHRPPYYGLVKRSSNRAPGPSDPWWADHQSKCGGTYIKIKEPPGYKKSKSSRKRPRSKTSTLPKPDPKQPKLEDLFRKPQDPIVISDSDE